MCVKFVLFWLPVSVPDPSFVRKKKKKKKVGVEKNGEACEDMQQLDFSDTAVWLCYC